jgi:hypothetical protein
MTLQKSYTTSRLARALGTSRQTLLEYQQVDHIEEWARRVHRDNRYAVTPDLLRGSAPRFAVMLNPFGAVRDDLAVLSNFPIKTNVFRSGRPGPDEVWLENVDDPTERILGGRYETRWSGSPALTRPTRGCLTPLSCND